MHDIPSSICEVQASSMVRAFPKMRVATLRPCLCFPEPPTSETNFPNQWRSIKENVDGRQVVNDCWGWTLVESIARACLLGVTSEGWTGSEVFWIVAPNTRVAQEGQSIKSIDLAKQYHPHTPVRARWFDGNEGGSFFDCSKARRLLGWQH